MADRAGVVPQLLGAAVGIVLGSALLFAVVGMLRDDAPAEPEIAAEPSPSATEAPADDGEPASPAAASPEGDPEPADEPSPEPTEQDEQDDEEPAESTEQVDPATVSIQVLDAIGGEQGSAAAKEVADQLRDAGFDVVVVNRAGRNYDVTTVFWSPGQAAGGQQAAATIDAGQAEETPEEVQLSDSVDVHVVVGADRVGGN